MKTTQDEAMAERQDHGDRTQTLELPTRFVNDRRARGKPCGSVATGLDACQVTASRDTFMAMLSDADDRAATSPDEIGYLLKNAARTTAAAIRRAYEDWQVYA